MLSNDYVMSIVTIEIVSLLLAIYCRLPVRDDCHVHVELPYKHIMGIRPKRPFTKELRGERD